MLTLLAMFAAMCIHSLWDERMRQHGICVGRSFGEVIIVCLPPTFCGWVLVQCALWLGAL